MKELDFQLQRLPRSKSQFSVLAGATVVVVVVVGLLVDPPWPHTSRSVLYVKSHSCGGGKMLVLKSPYKPSSFSYPKIGACIGGLD